MKYVLALALSLFFTCAGADSWVSASPAGFTSPSGRIVVRVVPGSNPDATNGGAHKGKAATATFYRLDAAANFKKIQEIPLLNPVAPVFAAVADSGEFVTLDNWRNMGIGDSVVVVYSSDGKVIRKYRLVDIYTEAEIKRFDRSVSSIWWRCRSAPIFDPQHGVLELTDVLGATVGINLKTGAVTRTQTSEKGC